MKISDSYLSRDVKTAPIYYVMLASGKWEGRRKKEEREEAAYLLQITLTLIC